MNRKTVALFFIFILLNIIYGNVFSREVLKESNKNYEVFDIFIEKENQYQNLKREFNQSAIFIRRKSSEVLRILLPLDMELVFVQFLKEHGIKFQKLDAGKEKTHHNISKREAPESFMTFDKYYRSDKIDSYMKFLAENYPHLARIKHVGKSYEGRDLNALYISQDFDSSTKRKSTPLILIDAGIHGREWIAPATALYIMKQLVEESNLHRNELRYFEWIVFPLVNPDGYEYSHDTDRMWRKNRRPIDEECVGTDLNRNFGYYWRYSGASKNPCSEIYAGPSSFSEPETVALRNLMFSVQRTCFMYLTLHSYGNSIVYPWGYSKEIPHEAETLDSIANHGANKIKQMTGTKYNVGSSARILYPAAGGSDDYAYAKILIPVVYCMELPSGGNEFDPPPEEILHIVSEAWLGIKAMTREAFEYSQLRSSAAVLKFNVILFILLVTKI